MSEKVVVGSVVFVFFAIILFVIFLLMKNKEDSDETTVFYPWRHWRHKRNKFQGSGCRCMRQSDGGTKGFCGICGSDGTTYGCPYDGEHGCNTDCTKLKYTNEKACDTCRDPNCDMNQIPVYEGFGCNSLSNAKY